MLVNLSQHDLEMLLESMWGWETATGPAKEQYRDLLHRLRLAVEDAKRAADRAKAQPHR